MREREHDLQDELKEMTQNYLRVKSERDQLRQQIQKFRQQSENVKNIVSQEVQKAVLASEEKSRKFTDELNQEIKKLQEHNSCYRETVEYLELQLKEKKEQQQTSAVKEKIKLAKMNDADLDDIFVAGARNEAEIYEDDDDEI